MVPPLRAALALALVVVLCMTRVSSSAPVTIRCLTAENRSKLVASCRKRAAAMHMYPHVAACFDKRLNEMTTSRTELFGASFITCMSKQAIYDAVVLCALDATAPRAVVRALAAPRRESPAALATQVRTAGPPLATSSRKVTRRRFPYCSRDFPCCLLATDMPTDVEKCLASWCDEYASCV